VLNGTKVLVVEDNEINMELSLDLLADVGITADFATNGLEAIDKVNRHTYELVLMDIQMPYMDGLSATREIRKKPDCQQLPILAMTAHAMKGEREKSLEAGMNDHITKPIDPMLLYAAICKFTGRTPVITEATSANEEKHENETVLSIAGLNTEAGLYRSGGNTKVFYKLLQSFSQKYANLGAQISELLDNDNTEELAALMHTFAGVAGNMGAEQLYERSILLSQQAKKAANDHIRLSELPISDDLNTIIEEASRLIEGITREIPVSKAVEESLLSEQSIEEAKEKIGRLSDLIRENNPEAANYASQIIGAYKFSEAEHKAILEAFQQLEQFEFDEALVRLNSIQHA
jgi:CheY-like chemotaxis protein